VAALDTIRKAIHLIIGTFCERWPIERLIPYSNNARLPSAKWGMDDASSGREGGFGALDSINKA
jgi:hypothetical protein